MSKLNSAQLNFLFSSVRDMVSASAISKIFAISLGLWSLWVSADYTATSHFSGFASIGIATNDNPDLTFRRDITQDTGSINNNWEWRNDTFLGVQWTRQWTYQLETSAQFVVKDRFENSLKNALEWGFFRYRPIDGLDIRLGRMGSDIFLVSDHRQVAYSYPWVRPPHEYYGFIAFYHFDGIDVNKRVDFDTGTLNIKSFYGRSDEFYPASFGGFRLTLLESGLSLSYELDQWKFRYSYATFSIQNNNMNALTDGLNQAEPQWPDAKQVLDDYSTKGKRFQYNELGFSYDNNTWWVQSEITELKSNADVLPTTRHFYATTGWRLGSISIFALKGRVYTATDEPVVPSPPAFYPPQIAQQLLALAAGAQYAFDTSRTNQQSMGVGARWDFTRKMAFKLQVDKFHVEKKGSTLWLNSNVSNIYRDHDARVISISMDLLF